MCSTYIEVPPEVAAAFDALSAAVTAIGELNLDNYAPGVRLQALELLEIARRQQAVPSHDLVASLAKEDAARPRWAGAQGDRRLASDQLRRSASPAARCRTARAADYH